MIMQHYTTIEQSKHLLELGLSPESADMCYGSISYDSPGPYCGAVNAHKPDLEFNDLPCWSLGALLDVIPFPTQTTTGNDEARVDVIYKSGFKNSCHAEEGETLLDVLVKMITWLLEKNYLKA